MATQEKREPAFDTSARIWINSLVNPIPPGTYERCTKITDQTTGQIREFRFKGYNLKTTVLNSRVPIFVEHCPKRPHLDIIPPTSFSSPTHDWKDLVVKPGVVLRHPDCFRPSSLLGVMQQEKICPLISVPFKAGENDDNLYIEGKELRELGFTELSIQNSGPEQLFPLTQVDFISKDYRQGIVRVVWSENGKPKTSTYRLSKVI